MQQRIRVGLWSPLPPRIGGISGWALRYLDAAPSHDLAVRAIDTASSDAFSENSAFRLTRLGTAVRCLARLAALLATRQIDVAHINTTLYWSLPRDALASLLCRIFRVPAMLHIRASTQLIEARSRASALGRLFIDVALRIPNQILVLSEELRGYLEAELPTLTVRTIGNMTAIAPDATEARRSGGPVRIVFVGHQIPNKGVALLLEAARRVRDCHLILIGPTGDSSDHTALEEIRTKRAALEEAGQLTNRGALSADEVQSELRRADVFVLPSLREGFPNALLEAMAEGLPCIASRVGAVPEMLDGCGMVVDVGNLQELTSAIGSLASDRERRLRLGRAAIERARDRYATPVVMARLREFYADAIGDGRNRRSE